MTRVGMRQYELTKLTLLLGTGVIIFSIVFARDVLTGVAALVGTTYGIVLSMYTAGKAVEWTSRRKDQSTITEQVDADSRAKGEER